MRKFELVIKGDPLWVLRHTQARCLGMILTIKEATKESATLTILSREDLTSKLNEWFLEERDPPFKNGSLLFWKEKASG